MATHFHSNAAIVLLVFPIYHKKTDIQTIQNILGIKCGQIAQYVVWVEQIYAWIWGHRSQLCCLWSSSSWEGPVRTLWVAQTQRPLAPSHTDMLLCFWELQLSMNVTWEVAIQPAHGGTSKVLPKSGQVPVGLYRSKLQQQLYVIIKSIGSKLISLSGLLFTCYLERGLIPPLPPNFSAWISLSCS